MRSIVTLLMATGVIACLFGCNLEKAVSQYEGDGSIRFIDGPLLGSDGVALVFDTFCISSNFNRTYTCNKVPSCDNYYVMYLNVEASSRLKSLENSIVSSRLVDSKGCVVWNIQTNLASWTYSENGSNPYVRYYFHKYEPSMTCTFTPKKDEKYSLMVSFETNPSCSNSQAKAMFSLEAGGYK